jgi:DNA-binding Xre family transcriptional regulator
VIKVNVPDLLEKSGLNATDMMREGRIAYGTALRLSKGSATGITFDVLEALCKLFDVQVSEILEYVPDK